MKWKELTMSENGKNHDATIMRLTGCRCLWIENYKGILDFHDTCIKIRGKPHLIVVKGKNLVIRSYDEDEMTIEGQIDSLDLKERW